MRSKIGDFPGLYLRASGWAFGGPSVPVPYSFPRDPAFAESTSTNQSTSRRSGQNDFVGQQLPPHQPMPDVHSVPQQRPHSPEPPGVCSVRARRHPPATQSPMALRPLPEGAYPRHDLGAMDLLCRKCSAFHWDFKRLGGRDTPVFRAFCDDGKVDLPKIKKPPCTLLELLTGNGQGMSDIMPLFLGAVYLTKTRCTVCTVEKLFREQILAFNENLAMASFGTSQDYGMIGAGGPPPFYLSGNVYHRMGMLAPARGSNPVFAQILFQLVIAYRQILPRLDKMMLQENRRAQQFLMAREFINREDAHAYQLHLFAPRN
ncbi:BQ5605_C015g07731 [Microbotryum silenes-dioicae]|uniref:BQ5605_C015g07731 protein n=1 Tax=Microbotryum silenes-dioicae TaxID=796604 RepID=A0A2X0NQD8_9BASI|nr:BQ5605_C015g07731 [Microbotryum silenes-dioicae]